MRYIFISVRGVKFDCLVVNILKQTKREKDKKTKKSNGQHLQGSQWDDE